MIRKFLSSIRQLHRRELPSDIHKEAWKKFERVLMIRTNVAFILRITLDLTNLLLGTGVFASSRQSIKEEKPHNEEFVAQNIQIFENIMNGIEVVRVLLVIASYKWLGVTKAVMYVQLAYMIIPEIGIPHDRGVYRDVVLRTNLLVQFILDYFDFYPAMGCQFVVLVA